MGLMSWGMGSMAVSAPPQQRRKFDSCFQKVKWFIQFIAGPGEDGVLPCPALTPFSRGWVCLLYTIVDLFMYKLRFFAVKGLLKICLKSQCGYRDCFHFSNASLRTGAVKAGKWKEIGSYYIQQVFLALSALETPVDLRRLTLSWIQVE